MFDTKPAWNTQAVSKEEEVWAAIEIQRHYRGYKGRVRAENALELVPLMQYSIGEVYENQTLPHW